MRKLLLTPLMLLSILIAQSAYAQESVGIGTSTPNLNSILDLDPNSPLGFLMPRLNPDDTVTLGSVPQNKGLIFYDTVEAAFRYYDGNNWILVGTGAGGGSGMDGRSILNGAADPTGGDGNDGDFWINTTTYNIFGPKTAGAWGAGTALIGASGTNGNTVLSGAVDPIAGDGNDGDYFINTSTNVIFGPKAAGAWPGGVSLIGPAGPAGADGDRYATTSVDNRTIAVGPLNITVDPGLAYSAAQTVVVANGANSMEGSVTSYNSGTGAMSIVVSSVNGGGTFSAWDVNLGGAPGPAGTDGNTILSGGVDPVAGDGVDGDFYINTGSNTIFGPKAAGAWPAGVPLIGPAGANGLDGQTVLNGNVDPVAGDGNDGDFYINTASNTIFGPKAAGAWPAGTSLVGPAGAAGAVGPAGNDGNTVLSGIVDPVAGDGVDGDYFINTASNTIFGPKAAGAWPAGTSLVGPAGAAGAAGTNGTDGNTVLSGIVDPAAGDGVDGDYFINTASNTIFGPKAAGAWPAGTSIVGPAGAAGTNGTDGNTILSSNVDPVAGDGVDGDYFINTASNTIFGPKAAGAWPAGTVYVGTNGLDGNTILSGLVDPVAGDGVDGDYFINTATDVIFGPKAAGAWPAGTSIVGPTGAAGADGDRYATTSSDNRTIGLGALNITVGTGLAYSAAQTVVVANGANSMEGSVISYNSGSGAMSINVTTVNGGGTFASWDVNLGGAPGPAGSDGNTVLSGGIDPVAGDGVDGDFYINTGSNTIFGPKAAGAWPAGVPLVGPAGAAGVAGADGQSVLNGAADPTAGDGNDGDFYINTTSNTLFGPKAAGAWPAGTSLVGPAGAAGTNGTDGNTVLSGIVDPVAGDGVDGDYFINTASNTIFGPKAAGAWPAGTSLVGPAGAAGLNGNTVLSGIVDPVAGDGVDGDYFINTASNNIFGPKAAGAWPAGTSLVGPAGAAGTNGTDGNTVLSGIVDPVAGDGVDGDYFINTASNTIFGPKAAGAWPAGTSLVGPAGAAGAAGAAGVDGNTVLSGIVDPVAGDGVDGDYFINTASNTIFGPKAAGAWPAGTSLVGPAGNDGNTVLSGIVDPVAGDGVDGDYFINTASNTIFGPKAAGAWPAGTSLVGPAGAAGTNGTDGNTILSSNVDPVAGDGVDGDYFINTASNTIFGPKAAGAWPAGTVYVGTNGLDGNTILSGLVDPVAGDGVDGDYFINTATDVIFGPKAAGAWPAGTSIVGPTGAAGADGDRYATTSSDNRTIGLGALNITVGTGLAYSAAQTVVVANGANSMEGSVISYNSGSGAMSINVTTVNGGGTFASWDVNLGGAPGPAGSDGNTVLSGGIDPVAGDGVDGDFYINTGSNTIFGPKAAGAWPAGVPLVGPAGAAGVAGADGQSVLNGAADPTAGDGNDGDFYINTTSNTLFGPKAAGAWPAGTSLVGPAGAAGTNGTDGNTVLSGIVDPVAGDGVDGDYFINTASNTIFGPKAAGAWPAGTSLVGPAGAAGLNGNTVLSGIVDPVAGDGVDGDYFINTASNNIFGPKAAGAWPAGTSLVGPAGAAGTNGTDGNTVLSGIVDPVAGDGVDGDYFINTASNNIFGPKAAGAWPAGTSLVGPAGAAGTNGTDGNTVLSGIVDPVAGDGVDGDYFINTASNTIFGPKAAGAWPAGTSLVGPAGAAGAAGAAGVDGNTVLSGIVDPVAGDGVDGDYFINTASNTIFGPKAAGAWPAGTSLVGPAGAAGAAGVDGNTILSSNVDPVAGDGVDGDYFINTASNTIFGPKTAGAWGAGTVYVGTNGIDGSSVLNGAGNPTVGDGVDGDFWINTSTNTIFGPKTAGAWAAGTPLVGPSGTDGATVLNGAGNPTVGDGVDGDFWINTSTNTIFGPKTAGAWAAGTPLVGPSGTDGAAVLNGAGNPTAGDGNDGDFWINTSTNTIFGPKTAGAWAAGTPLVGPAGPSSLQAAYDGGQSITMTGTDIDIQTTGGTSILYLDDTNERLGIGVNTPSEVLSVAGNVRFSGALMPANDAGTAGQVLTSAGAGAAPTWSTSSVDWSLTGNSGTIDGTNFLGTTDAVALNFRVNNFESGRVGVGATANTFFGYRAGEAANININAVGIGTAALRSLTSGDANVAIGVLSMTGMITGTGNVAVGYNTLAGSSAGVDNVAIGYSTMVNADGDRNTTVGSYAMQNGDGFDNSAYGYGALRAAGTKSDNTAIGVNSQLNNATGNMNTAVGLNSLRQNTAGSENTTIGFNSLYNSTGNWNAAIGHSTLFNLASGSYNTGLGGNAGLALTGGSFNTFVGYGAQTTSGSFTNATAIGANAVVSQDNSLVLGDNVRVGIGTSAPTVNLEIFRDSPTEVAVNVENSNANGDANLYLSNDVTGYVLGSSGSSGSFPEAFRIGNTSLGSVPFFIDGLNRVGINSTNPNANLTIFGDSVNFIYQEIHNINGNGSTSLDFVNNANERMELRNDGTLATNPQWFIYDDDAGEIRLSVDHETGHIGIGNGDSESLSILSVYDSVSTGESIVEIVNTNPDNEDGIALFASSISGGTNFGIGIVAEGNYIGIDANGVSAGYTAIRAQSLDAEHAIVALGDAASTSALQVAANGASYAATFEGAGVGIGTTNPVGLLSVGAGNEFAVASDGDLGRIKGVPYDWPNANGAGLLSNDGAGNLSWTAPTGFTADNGLTLTGSDLDLGGNLTQNTEIVSSGFAFTVGSAGTMTGSSNIALGFNNDLSGTGGIAIGSNNTISANRGVALGSGVQVTGLGGMALGDWSASTPGATVAASDQFVARFNNGFRFFTNSDPASNPNEGLFVDASGNVGIGDATPSAELEVASASGPANIRVSGATNGVVTLNAASTSDMSNLNFTRALTTVGGVRYAHNATSTSELMSMRVAGTDVLNIEGTGEVGIGTTTPDQDLEVENTGQAEIHVDGGTNAYLLLDAGGTTNFSNLIFQRAGSTRGAVRYDHNASATAEQIQFQVNNTTEMVIEGTGEVGIGNTIPAFELDVTGDINSTTGYFYNSNEVLSVNTFNDAVFVGSNAGHTNAPRFSTHVGQGAGAVSTAVSNTLVGYQAGFDLNSGGQNTMMGIFAGTNTTTGTYNTFIGRSTGDLNLTGSNNTIVGGTADVSVNNISNTTGLGYGVSISGANGTAIGYQATAVNDATAIGAGAVASTANSVVLGDNEDVIGIGTSSPGTSYALEVENNTKARNILIDNNYNGASTSYGLFISSGSTSGQKYGVYAAGETRNYFNGDMGIGTTAPGSRLDIVSTLNTTDPIIELNNNSGGDVSIEFQSSNDFTLGWDESDDAFKIYDGNSLGTTTALTIMEYEPVPSTGEPSMSFNVANGERGFLFNSADTWGTALSIANTSNTGGTSSKYAFIVGGTTNTAGVAPDDFALVAGLVNDVVFTIDQSAGFDMNVSTKLGVGVSPVAKFQVNSTTASELALRVQKNGTTRLAVQDDGTVSVGTVADAAYALYVSGTAGKTSGGSTWAVVSDERLKNVDGEFNDGLDVIREINPIWYRYNGKAGIPVSEEAQVGILAQDLEKIAPYTISTFNAKMDSTDSQETEFLQFNFDALNYAQINAIKELADQIDKLKAEIEVKNKEISELKSEIENDDSITRDEFEKLKSQNEELEASLKKVIELLGTEVSNK